MPARFLIEEKPQHYVEGGGGPWTPIGVRASKRSALVLAQRRWCDPNSHKRKLQVIDTRTRVVAGSVG